MNQSKITLLIVVLVMSCHHSFSQCADPSNIYSFVYDGHSYEVVKENKTWTEASACAVSRDGYLAEMNDEEEQAVIFTELTENAGITISSTQNQFGTASIWLGGSDAGAEGNWIWDGDNDGIGPQFWSGGPSGTVVGGLYNNWGINPAEPDNSGGQDYLTLIIKPTAVNFGLWNDLIATNSIYYLIEYSGVLSIEDVELKINFSIYPNPFGNYLTIDNTNSVAIDKMEIVTLLGQKIKTIGADEMVENKIDVSDLNNGVYLLQVHFENGEIIGRKIVK